MSDRNNLEKLAAPEVEQEASFVPNSPKNNSNPFSFLQETMFVDLPSEGKYYDNEPLSTGQVEIYYMNAAHEDILANKNYIRKNQVIDKFLEAIIVNNEIDSKKLLAADRTAIMYEARSAAYGETFTSKITCSACGKNNEVEISLDDVEVSSGEPVEDKAFITNDKTVKIKLPVASELSGRDFYVELIMSTGEIESKLKSVLDDDKSGGFKEALSMLVVDVDGHKDISTIRKFLNVMRAADSLFIKDNYKKACPYVRLFHDFVCSNNSCNNVVEDMEVGITANFFWPQL